MDMSMNMSVGAADVRENRERRGLTPEELAEEVGVSVEVVKAWESGERLVPKRRMATVRSVLGMDEFSEAFGRPALLRRLGELAKQRREELGIGRVPFSKEIGLGSDKTLVQFEFGRTLPIDQSLMRIEKGLGWRVGSVDSVLRMVNRKASEIRMEELDAEDSLTLAAQSPRSLSLYSDKELLEEVGRRMAARSAQHPHLMSESQERDPKNMYGLAASTNTEHLEDEEGNK